ncbi:type IV pili methyl-accepting chemotaxis transducer N-terminal domain-containing protein [Arcobacter sp. CECT 8985]|uniref:type IV pili methyl-accepting chemotaxis transducer N-terminal domain-containing protein n=1 Tax=Arcobacter sp. CECT 8985 TaxID=1935424 RepID=UPI00100AC2EC|nr:type IV pili methyl-accepting chemotaxis transducer N-terminal domain-containing protein [Arcobacter sp. CECT 8985]RXJ86267.1 hypothetical protein CRU93_09405 [Arcobacter sp. CECT 8985]
MKKTQTISSKIKTIGLIFIILIISVIGTTIYLNAKNEKDALIINIAGKQRMLTQRISKNVFYLYHNNNKSFVELNNAAQEFIYNLNSLKNGNKLIGINKAPTNDISKQISKVEILWSNFYNNINTFKNLIQIRDTNDKKNEKILKSIVENIYETNNTLLTQVDKIVSLYTAYSEKKTNYIKYFQYFFAIIIILLIVYSYTQLKSMEQNAKKFLEITKKIKDGEITEPIELIEFDAEEEIVEATSSINCFINKINSAMQYSNNASKKLEDLTNEFDEILDEIKDSNDLSNQLFKSEDMVIESQENLLTFTHKLEELKKELNSLSQNCKSK